MRAASMNVIGRGVAAALLAAVSLGAVPPPAHAQNGRVVVSGDAGIHTWIEQSDDVVVSIRPMRDCYATLYVVDMNGVPHVVYPTGSGKRAWVRAGVTYRYSAQALGLERFNEGGVTQLFAVGVPPQKTASPRVVSTSHTVRESMREYREKYRRQVDRRMAELASARTMGPQDREFAKQQRVTKRKESASKGKPTSTRAAKTRSDSERNEEGKAGPASSKAR